MANFDIHIGSIPINYTNKVTFKNVENCDALNNDIPLILVSNIIEVHSLLTAYLAPTNVKSLVITHIVQDDPNQFLKYNDVPVTTSQLPLIIPVDDLDVIEGLSLVEQYVPSNNITSIRVDFYIVDDNDTIGPSVTSYIQAKKVECTAEPVIRDPFITNINIAQPDYQECQDITFTIDRNGSVNPIKYKVTTLQNGAHGYIGNLQDADTALGYIGSAIGDDNYYKGTIHSSSPTSTVNMIYRVCASPALMEDNWCHVIFQIFKEDGVTINQDYLLEFKVYKEFTGGVGVPL